MSSTELAQKLQRVERDIDECRAALAGRPSVDLAQCSPAVLTARLVGLQDLQVALQKEKVALQEEKNLLLAIRRLELERETSKSGTQGAGEARDVPVGIQGSGEGASSTASDSLGVAAGTEDPPSLTSAFQKARRVLLERPSVVVKCVFSVYGGYGTRAALFSKMVEFGVHGEIRRLNIKEVRCRAIAEASEPGVSRLVSLLSWVTKDYAAYHALDLSELPETVSPHSPRWAYIHELPGSSREAEDICLHNSRRALKVTLAVRATYASEKCESCISEDRDEFVSAPGSDRNSSADLPVR